MQSKFTTRGRFTTLALSLCCVIAYAAASYAADPAPIAPHPAPAAAPDTSTLTGKPAPEFSLPTLDKKDVKLAEQKGKVVMLDFWATWCPPCRASLPHVQKLASDEALAKKGLVVWVVNDKEDEPTVTKFMKENNYTFTVPMDKPADVLKKYLVRGIPTTVIIGRDGTIRNVFIGYGAPTAKQIDQAVEKALAEPSTAAAN